ncbi:rab11 family-interacting protein 5 isoform X1 [Phasianus colchicus]|uniref:RAB11 family interacting protein 5 n=1 Tax=Phasianus colchicus TaxID=9054 RepID=A0A669PNC1_PHACC|nr:rab11 family-interacting protein 5 isoform X1 [Phasianus colchicus]
MALLRAAALPADGPPAWLPTHVQVTVVRARGLRCKGGGGGGGKAGSSDAYTIIQLGREKYCTSVAEKSGGCPEWKEECAFELPPTEPGVEAAVLLTVMHRALVGMDRFLGMARVPLRAAGLQGRAAEERWHKLHSKPGKKEKERGEIQVSIQFTRNNLTASMFDLSMKDKPRSPFGKLKDKMKGKKKYDLESASAIIPSSMGALDMEDDYDVGGKKSKVKGFFLKNKLRKSSLTQSNTSLGSDSTISSASLGMATSGPEVTRSPSRHSSLSTERSVKDFLPSPKLTHKRAFSDDVSQVSPILEPKAIHSLKLKTDPVSRSSLCINGSHVYSDEPTPRSPVPTPQGSTPLPVPKRPEEGFGFIPIHNDPHEVPWGASSLERTQQRDEMRFIPSPPSLVLQEELKVSTKAVTLSNHLGRARMEENNRLENKPTQVATPMVFSAEVTKEKQPEEMRKEEKKTKGGLFHKSDAGSRGQGEKTGASHGSAAVGDDRSKAGGWFGSKEPKDSPQKPSFPSEPHASTEVAGSLCSSEDCSPSASLRLKDPEGEPPAKSVGVPVPETTPPSHADPPPPDEEPTASPPPLSEWDETFDAFATSRLRPDSKKEDFFTSVAAEGMAFIDDPNAASPTERSAEPDPEEGTQGFEKAEPQISSEMPPALRSWTNFSGLDVGANLVSTTQEATVIEDVLSPVSAGSAARRRKSSTPMVWAASLSSGNPGEKEASTLLSSDNCAGEERDSNEEETSSVGENGWMTIATETAPDPSESTQSIGQGSVFGQRSFHGEGTFETKSTPRVLPQSTFSSENTAETILGSNVAAVPPRVLQDMAAGCFPVAPDMGKELQDDGREMFDIRSSVYRLQASMRLEAGEGHVKMGSDAVLTMWTGVRGKEEVMPPPKPPRWFAAVCGRGEDENNASDTTARQRGGEEQQEGEEGLEQPRSHLSGDTAVLAPHTAVHEDAADVEAGGDTSLGEEPLEMNGTDVAEHFETCPSRFSVDELTPSGAAGSWNQLALSPVSQLSLSAEPSIAPEQKECPEELGVSAPDLSLRPDSGQPETFWTALEEQEALGRPHRLAPEQHQGEGPAVGCPHQAEQGWPPAGIDFKKVEFWKLDRTEERSEQDAASPGNPFALAVSPIAPTNPFVEKPADALPVQAVLPERFSSPQLHGEALQQGFQPTNPPGDPLGNPSLHDSQPLAFSTPFPVAVTNPEQFDFPSPAATSHAAAQPCPLPQSGDTQASALVVLPRETQPAEKPFFQQMTSPHPVKPISAAVQEVSSEKKQQNKSSLTTALSNGLEKLKTVTTGSVQPVAPSSHLEKTDPKKDPNVLDQSAKYYHLTHDELIQLLLQREKELSKKEEHIQELENYIDQLLVRIMEQSPTLLQIPLGEAKTK